jgi:phosphoribosyl 1,2-cyclic phosphodiesterase
MIAKVLGCSGSIAARCATTAFLIDETILIDAGTGVGDMELDALMRVDHILLSHARLDRVASLPLFADTVLRRRSTESQKPVLVYGLPATLKALQEHIFNGVVWPDFTRLPSREHPVIQLVPFAVNDVLSIGDKRVEILSAVDALPAVGFAVHGRGSGSWVYVCNTAANPKLWERLRELEIAHLVIGCEAFVRDGAPARHALAQELVRFKGKVDVHLADIGSADMIVLVAEMRSSSAGHRIRHPMAGDEMRFANG